MTGRRNCLRIGAFVIALATAPVASTIADPISATSTGNVETDFPSGTTGITTLVNPKYPTNDPASYIARNNLSPGWSIKDIRLYYDKATDTMDVGVNFFGIAGDADGNGNPGTSSTSNGFVDMPHLGGRESITIGFDFLHTGQPQVLAGVPGDKTQSGSGNRRVQYHPEPRQRPGPLQQLWQTLTSNMGNLVFDPSAAHPDFEFTIKNFSTLPGYNPNSTFNLIAFAGSPDDGVEEEGVRFSGVSGEVIHPSVPEPATWLAWSLGLAGVSAFNRFRRRRDPRSL